MKKMRIIIFICLIGIIALFKFGLSNQETDARQQTSNSVSSIIQTTDSSSENLIKIGKEDATLYADSSLSEPLNSVNAGELATLLSTTDNAYKITMNDGETGYLSLTDGSSLTRSTQELPSDLSEAVIVLDPGHGGDDTGALSTDGHTEEKTVTLAAAKQLQTSLEAAGATVYLTHETDDYISLDDICAFSEEKAADLFISLHADSTESANEATGTTTYYYYNSEQRLAETVSDELADLPIASRGTATGNYQVLRENLQPSLLIEMGYMNNDEDLATLTTVNYQQQLAQSITQALLTYFNQ
ncbi:N-acetylmuramoyl-L-alanine amidase family protein [Enterococcus mundtii]|uniref:N-acetylmuramoyl-L-alanine amidase family protein n=1 Tax=Enterococcus mundtii TaxID=53346 RepID=UPI0008260642|nr:N-acetylmuramoyl-L-alanine amidase [Enterococcus mundtii]